jgi:hypothetical protein
MGVREGGALKLSASGLNLIEQTQPTPERESFSQTDEFLPRTVQARNATTNDMFMRPKIGIDTSTQVGN